MDDDVTYETTIYLRSNKWQVSNEWLSGWFNTIYHAQFCGPLKEPQALVTYKTPEVSNYKADSQRSILSGPPHWWMRTQYLRQVLKEESTKSLSKNSNWRQWQVLIKRSPNYFRATLERESLICYHCSSYWFILCSWIIFKKFMVHFYGNSQSCISLVCIARSLRQEETDGFSIIDVNELPSVASLRNAIKSKSQISGTVHTTQPH